MVKKLILATLVAAAAAILVASVAPTQYTDGGSKAAKRSSAQPGYAAPQTQAVPAKNAYSGANKNVNFQQSNQQQSDPYGYGQQQGSASTSGQEQQGQGYSASQASAGNQSSTAAGKEVKLATSLVGSEEKPGPGDPAGSGQAWVTVKADNSVCYKVTWSGLSQPATAAHIHKGVKGLPGDVVVPFFGNGKKPSGKGIDESCAQVQDLAVVEGLRKNPQNYYVNVHTAQFPQGAIRGQLAFASGALPLTGAERTPVMLGLGFGVLAAGFVLLTMVRYRPRRLAVGGAHTRRR